MSSVSKLYWGIAFLSNLHIFLMECLPSLFLGKVLIVKYKWLHLKTVLLGCSKPENYRTKWLVKASLRPLFKFPLEEVIQCLQQCYEAHFVVQFVNFHFHNCVLLKYLFNLTLSFLPPIFILPKVFKCLHLLFKKYYSPYSQH